MSRQPLRSRKPRSRRTFFRPLLIGVVLAGCADREPPTAVSPSAQEVALPGTFDEWGRARLVVDLEIDPGSPIVRGVVLVSAPDREPTEFGLERQEDELFGTIAVPVGEELKLEIRTFDEGERETHGGGTVLAVKGEEPMPQLDLLLEPRSDDAGAPIPAFVGSYRLVMSPRQITAERMGDELRIEGRLLGPDGELVPMDGEIEWRPPEDFEGDYKWTLEDGVASFFGFPLEPPKKVSPFELCYLTFRYCRTTLLIPDDIPPPDWYELVDGGGSQTCVMKHSGRTRCWGAGAHVTPSVLGAFRFRTVSAGGLAWNDTHACAIDRSSVTWCWGDNSRGQLGTNSLGIPASSAQPVKVHGPQVLVSVSAGGRHSCGLDAAGTAYCWGDNDWGQLGAGFGGVVGSPPASAVPLRVAGNLTFRQISAGYEHTCGLTTGGDLYCWGYGVDVRLGSYDPNEYCGSPANNCAHAPRPVAPVGVKFATLSAGDEVSCALSTVGTAYCWGVDPLGSYNQSNSLKPLEVTGGHSFSAIAVGHGNVCALKDDQQVLCWGYNSNGETGTGDQLRREIPDTVNSTARYQAIGAGPSHFCAITVGGGRVDCWGRNAGGETGLPLSPYVLSPTPAPNG